MSGIAMAAILSGGSTSVELDTDTVTVGSHFDGAGFSYGFRTSPAFGSIADGTFAPKASAFDGLFFYSLAGITLKVVGEHSNDGWTTMTVESTSFDRGDATSFGAGSGFTTWFWSTGLNPFGTTVGATRTVVFT